MGASSPHKITPLPVIKPPNAIINKKGSIRAKNSWVNRKKLNFFVNINTPI
jgi:hypothetical protein